MRPTPDADPRSTSRRRAGCRGPRRRRRSCCRPSCCAGSRRRSAPRRGGARAHRAAREAVGVRAARVRASARRSARGLRAGVSPTPLNVDDRPAPPLRLDGASTWRALKAVKHAPRRHGERRRARDRSPARSRRFLRRRGVDVDAPRLPRHGAGERRATRRSRGTLGNRVAMLVAGCRSTSATRAQRLDARRSRRRSGLKARTRRAACRRSRSSSDWTFTTLLSAVRAARRRCRARTTWS